MFKYILILLYFLQLGSSLRLVEQEQDDDVGRMAHHTPIILQDSSFERNRILERKEDVSRLLQDNPFSPTGQIMTTTPGAKLNDQILTIDLINQIVQQAGISTRPGNVTTNTSALFVTGNNASTLNISLSGLNTAAPSLGNQSWSLINVDDYAHNPYWVAANNYLLRLNLTFYPNQILILSTQNSTLGTAFNVTFRSVRGFVNAIVLVNQTFVASLINTTVLRSPIPAPANNTTNIYNVTRSLLQSLFYDFTLAPLALQNGTETKFPLFTLFDLRYQSKNGIYNFVVKSEDRNGSIVGIVLSCNPITINVSTQTVPVVASINLVNVDGNFKSSNNTINDFIKNNLNISNYTVQYNSVVVWANRAGTATLYFVNLTIIRPSSNQTFLAGVSYNLTNRYPSISYWRSAEPAIASLSPNSSDYQEVRYLDVVTNSIFANVDLSARVNYPTLVVGPLVKIETEKVGNQTGYRLTYFGVNGQNVQAAYRPPSN